LKINVFVLKNYVVIFIQFKKIKICWSTIFGKLYNILKLCQELMYQ
jgi:hypothetical protein